MVRRRVSPELLVEAGKKLTSSSFDLGGRSRCRVIETSFCSTFGVFVPKRGCLLASRDLRGDVGEVGAGVESEGSAVSGS